MKTTLRNTILLFSFVALILSGFIYFYLYYETNQLVEKTLSARKLVGVAEANRAQAKEMMKLYESSALLRQGLKDHYVPKKSAVVFIQAIEAIGPYTRAKIDITNINEKPPEKDSKTGSGLIQAEINVSGSWPQVMRTLEMFETMPYEVKINEVSLSIEAVSDLKSATSTRKWRMSIGLSVPTTNVGEATSTPKT